MSVVVMESAELQRLVEDAVASGVARAAVHDDWIDGHSSPMGHRAFLRLAREGAFPASLIGNKIMARRSAVDAYMDRQQIEPKAALTPRPSTLDIVPERDLVDETLSRLLDAGRLKIVKNPGK